MVTDGLYRIPVRAPAVEVDRDHSRRDSALSRARLEFVLEQSRIEVPAGRITVDENRACARVHDGVGSGCECQGRYDDLVAGADTQRKKREMKRRRTAREGNCVSNTEVLSDLDLERVDVRTERCDPVRVKGVQEPLTFGLADVGRRKVYAAHRIGGHARRSPRSCTSLR